MKVSQILKAIPKTENLIVLSSDMSAQDFLVVVRRSAKKLCHLGYLYINSHRDNEIILAKDPNSLNFDEFTYLLMKKRDSVQYMLERKYSLTDFQLMEWLKPKKSTPKRDIINHILSQPELLFEHFKEETTKVIVESVEVLKDYERIERDGYALYYRPEQERDVLPDTEQLEYWRLINPNGHDLSISLLEDDADVLHKIEAFVNEYPQPRDFRVEVRGKQLLPRENDEEETYYRTDIFELEKEFGIRKQSKKATLAEGLRSRKNPEIVQEMLGGKILISQYPPRIGETMTKETFEAIALHLNILFVEERKGILCEVTQKESEEIVHALWSEHGLHFYPVLVETKNLT